MRHGANNGGGCGGAVTRASTLLIDDDPNNVGAALKHGTAAVLLNLTRPDDDLVEALLSLPPCDSPVP